MAGRVVMWHLRQKEIAQTQPVEGEGEEGEEGAEEEGAELAAKAGQPLAATDDFSGLGQMRLPLSATADAAAHPAARPAQEAAEEVASPRPLVPVQVRGGERVLLLVLLLLLAQPRRVVRDRAPQPRRQRLRRHQLLRRRWRVLLATASASASAAALGPQQRLDLAHDVLRAHRQRQPLRDALAAGGPLAAGATSRRL